MLYQEKLAPLIITLGGGDPADRHSEGGVGHDFLMAHGVPDSAIIAENREREYRGVSQAPGGDCAREPSGKCSMVSDGTHLFRVHALCASMGLNVATSPRPELRMLPFTDRAERTVHEILSYSYWRFKALAVQPHPPSAPGSQL